MTDAKGLSGVQRYDFTEVGSDSGSYASMEKGPCGHYVRYTDHAALAERLKAIEEERDNYCESVKLVAGACLDILAERDQLTTDLARVMAERDTLKADLAQVTADIERGFMQGAYARLLQLQKAERERDTMRAENARLWETLEAAYRYIEEYRHGKARAVLFDALHLAKKSGRMTT